MSSKDVQKRRAWEARLARYRASGLSVSRFCEREEVSVHTFYYWAKRLKTASVPSLPGVSATPGTADRPEGAVVRFRWKAGVEVVVPAECLGAIRCLAECLAQADGRRGVSFQEVVVKP
jgi:hypothetical protein